MVTGVADPRAQLAICTGVAKRDALSCIRGTKVTNLPQYDPRIYPMHRRRGVDGGTARDVQLTTTG